MLFIITFFLLLLFLFYFVYIIIIIMVWKIIIPYYYYTYHHANLILLGRARTLQQNLEAIASRIYFFAWSLHVDGQRVNVLQCPTM